MIDTTLDVLSKGFKDLRKDNPVALNALARAIFPRVDADILMRTMWEDQKWAKSAEPEAWQAISLAAAKLPEWDKQWFVGDRRTIVDSPDRQQHVHIALKRVMQEGVTLNLTVAQK